MSNYKYGPTNLHTGDYYQQDFPTITVETLVAVEPSNRRNLRAWKRERAAIAKKVHRRSAREHLARQRVTPALSRRQRILVDRILAEA
jgi:hypothetical protein